MRVAGRIPVRVAGLIPVRVAGRIPVRGAGRIPVRGVGRNSCARRDVPGAIRNIGANGTVQC